MTRAWILRALWSSWLNRVALAVVAVVVGCSILAPWLAPHDPASSDLLATFAGPGTEGHLLGTDDLGRDILSRLLHAGRASLGVGVMSVGVALLVGVPVGLAAGYRGGWLDAVVMRVVDMMLSVPPLIFVFAISGVVGPSLRNAALALAVFFTPLLIRLTRTEARRIARSPLADAERLVGLSDVAIVRRHVLPLVAAPLIVQASLSMGTAILAEASLSFLGLGVQPPDPSWGIMLRNAFSFLRREPWAVVPPAVAIAATVLALNILGDAVRDALGREVR